MTHVNYCVTMTSYVCRDYEVTVFVYLSVQEHFIKHQVNLLQNQLPILGKKCVLRMSLVQQSALSSLLSIRRHLPTRQK